MLLKTLLIALVAATCALPVEDTRTSTDAKKTTLIAAKTDGTISPINQPTDMPNADEFEEVQEEDIPDGTWVLQVDEPLAYAKIQGENMQAADNVVFRPLFRYREKQSLRRRIDASKRYRRRYYVPRRSYRPYRSAYYYNPYRYRY